LIIIRRAAHDRRQDKVMKFRVIRPHEGDRFYNEGEIREGKRSDFVHLIGSVLEPVEESAVEEGASLESGAGEEKSEAALPNKAEPPLANKAETGRKGKKA